jgi:hypothetical protein
MYNGMGFSLRELGIAPITAQAKACDYKYFCLTAFLVPLG